MMMILKVADWCCHSVALQEGSCRNVVQQLWNSRHQAACVRVRSTAPVDWKCRTWKWRTIEIARDENVRRENAGHENRRHGTHVCLLALHILSVACTTLSSEDRAAACQSKNSKILKYVAIWRPAFYVLQFYALLLGPSFSRHPFSARLTPPHTSRQGVSWPQ